ncbi:hypothetical protein ACFE04_004425 [Oxalis oulophora]
MTTWSTEVGGIDQSGEVRAPNVLVYLREGRRARWAMVDVHDKPLVGYDQVLIERAELDADNHPVAVSFEEGQDQKQLMAELFWRFHATQPGAAQRTPAALESSSVPRAPKKALAKKRVAREPSVDSEIERNKDVVLSGERETVRRPAKGTASAPTKNEAAPEMPTKRQERLVAESARKKAEAAKKKKEEEKKVEAKKKVEAAEGTSAGQTEEESAEALEGTRVSNQEVEPPIIDIVEESVWQVDLTVEVESRDVDMGGAIATNLLSPDSNVPRPFGNLQGYDGLIAFMPPQLICMVPRFPPSMWFVAHDRNTMEIIHHINSCMPDYPITPPGSLPSPLGDREAQTSEVVVQEVHADDNDPPFNVENLDSTPLRELDFAASGAPLRDILDEGDANRATDSRSIFLYQEKLRI